jgi:uncharacterized protein YcfL
MKNALFVILAISFLAVSCRSLTSVTTIKGKQSFVLGNNPHGGYSVKLRNTAQQDLTIMQSDLDGKVKSTTVAKSNERLNLQVAPNTALWIQNAANTPADVELKIVGVPKLSMGYKN